MTNKQILEDAPLQALQELMRCFNWRNGYDDYDKNKFFTIVHNALTDAEPTKARALDNANNPMDSSMQGVSEPKCICSDDNGYLIGKTVDNNKNCISKVTILNDGEAKLFGLIDRVKGVSDERAEFKKWLATCKSVTEQTPWKAWQARSQLSTNTDGCVSDNANAKDVERYQFIKDNYAMANFDLYDAEIGEPKVCGIIFEVPNGTLFSADFDATIDSAIKAQQERN